MYIDLSRVSIRIRLVGVLLIVGLGLGLGAPEGWAFEPTKTPAQPVDSSRWTGGALKPGGIMGDSTGFDFGRDPGRSEPFYFGLDIENGWVFVVTGRGLKIFDANVNPSSPTLVSYGYGPDPATEGSGGLMPVWGHSDEDWFLQDVDAPPGDDKMAAVAGWGQGFSVWDTSDKANPRVHYQDEGVGATAVYSALLGSPPKPYAFTISNSGIYLYDLAVAQTKTKCLDNSATASLPCGGVYKGKVGNTVGPISLHGAGPFIAAGTLSGFEIWNVATPTAPPIKVMAGTQPARGIAMWQAGSSYYLAVSNFGKVWIYDVSCIANGECSAPAAMKVLSVPNGSPPLSRVYVSKASGGVPYLYVTGADTFSCPAQAPLQREYLFNVSDPANPVEITPTVSPLGYWSWYYELCSTGFNWVSPLMGKFNGNNFYRAAYSLLDVHQLAAAQPPTANFTWSPIEIYPGTQVQFTDQSSGSPAPDSWNWTFTDAPSPSQSSTAQNPVVTFNNTGTKTVTLKSHNSQGDSSPVAKTLTVLDPTPQIGSVTVSPLNPVTCQPITFTANDVTGRPTLLFSWSLPNAAPAPSPTNANPLVWNTTASTTPGTYTATVTVSNGQGSAAKSVNVTVGALQTINPIFTPTNDSFSAGTVKLHDNQPAGSATEWSWDFDDDGNAATTLWGPWTSDPGNGPSPTHTYTATGLKTVRVRVRNCTTPDQTNGIASGPLAITISQVTPLKAAFVAQCSGGLCFINAGQSVTFVDQSTGAELWDYDWDGNGSFEDAGNTAPRTAHTFATQGTFMPILKVRRGASEQDVTPVPAGTIIVGAPTPASLSISGPSSGQANQALSFTASAGGSCQPSADGWNWSSAGGTITGGMTASATITWSSDGTKSITVTNSACSGVSGTKTVTIGSVSPPPPPPPTGLQAAFTFSPAAPAVNQTVSFNGLASTGSPTGYVWDFGDGTAFSSGAQVTHIFTKPGSYPVQLSVTGAGSCPPAPFCASSTTKSVVVTGTNPPPTGGPQFTVSPASPRATEAVTFDSSSSTNIPAGSLAGWSFGDGSSPAFGPIVLHAFPQQGSYNVVLSFAPPGCTAVSCLLLASKTVVVGPPPPLSVDFSTDATATCSSQLGFDQCNTQARKAVRLTASVADASSYAWSFGDGSTGSSQQVTHSWTQPGSYSVTLTITKGTASATKTRTFVVDPAPTPRSKSVLLPWVSQSRGPLVQSNDLYVNNPGSTPLDVTLEFRRRGTVEDNPPRVPTTIAPGATLYVPDVLRALFSQENVAGFIRIETSLDSVEPVITSFDSRGQSQSKLFGQTIAGMSLSSVGSAAGSGPADTSQFLIGLNDTAERQASVTVSNPSDETATYRLLFVEKTGRPITESPEQTLAGFSQRQFTVQDIRDQFGVNNIEDYRIEVKAVSGARVVPLGSDVRLATGDPSSTGTGSFRTARLYLLGAFTGAGAAKSVWQTDLLLANVGDQAVQTNVRFTPINKAAGKAADVTVAPGETERLENVLFTQFGLRNGTGLLTLTSTSPNGVFPIATAESYDNTNPQKRFGQTLVALSDADAADTTKKQVLVGLRQDGVNKTTLLLFNPSDAAGQYDLVYRGLNGAVLGTLKDVKLGAGQLRQFAPSQHPLKKSKVANGFTVEVVVKSGKALAVAQVVKTSTNDPAYVRGVTVNH